MPIYEYRCQDCQALFEKLVFSTSDQENVACKKCGGKNVEKAISAPCQRVSYSSGVTTSAGARSGCASRGGFS